MRKSEKYPIQIRLSDADRRRIKSLAAKHGFTLQDAVVEAFDAWAEKLRTQPNRASTAVQPNRDAYPDIQPVPRALPPDWLKSVFELNWTGCPEVELSSDGANDLWLFCGSDAPVNSVLHAFADGHPPAEIAEVFGIELLSLAKVVQFAAAAYEANAANALN